jgi:hypothetical protein
MVNKRAQLSIETMIIYGLVILVALSVIGGLLYFNVIDLGSYLPDKCDLGGSGDLKCEEMKFTTTGLELGVRNIGQKPIEYLNVSVTDQSGIHFSGEKGAFAEVQGSDLVWNEIDGTVNAKSLAPGEIGRVVIDTGGALSGKLLRGTLKTNYRYSGGAINQGAIGSIRIKAS